MFSDDATLSEGLAQTIALVHDTATVAGTAAEPQLEFDSDHRLQGDVNADPDQIDELSNNHSFSDHSNQARYPGYDDCDAWQNFFDDGWSAYYAVTAGITSLSEEEQGELLDAVWAYWESQGYTVQTLTQDQGSASYTRYWIDSEYGRIQFNVDPRRGTAAVRGITDCLPPG